VLLDAGPLLGRLVPRQEPPAARLLGSVSVVQNGKPYHDNGGYLWKAPTFAGQRVAFVRRSHRELKCSEDIAAGLIAFWVHLLRRDAGAFAISFYFSSNTIIYYLLRKEFDATEMVTCVRRTAG
jgi:hypothetical protein